MAKSNTVALSFDEAMGLLQDDKINMEFRELQKEHGPALSGLVDMVDSDGRVCFRKRPNLVVLRGRTFALEKLFGDTIGSSGVNNGVQPYISELNRTVLCFGVGKGGAPASDPFTPYSASAAGSTGVALASRVPFRLHDTTKSASGDPLQFIPSSEIINYGTPIAVSGSTTKFNYHLKHFDARDPEWNFDEASATVFKKVVMSINTSDARTNSTNYINELGLYFSRAAGFDARGGVVFSNPELFSRVTFPSEYLAADKTLEITYRVYA